MLTLAWAVTVWISCDRRFLYQKRPTFFCHELQHRNSPPDCCQSSQARVPSENRAHFNIYWNVIKTTQRDSRQSMLFRLYAAEAGLPALAAIVCPHAIHPHPSEEKMVESHLRNSSPRGTVQLRLHADWLQCVLIDRVYTLHTREKCRNMVKGMKHCVEQKARPAGFLCISNNTRICQFSLMQAGTSSLPEEDPLANWMITVPVLKHTTLWQILTNCYTDSNKEIQGVINDKWNCYPQGDSIRGERK